MGRFIVIDGLDGSGKHTQLTRLADHLRANGKKVRTIDFPHYHTPGCVLVEEYLNGKFGDKPEDTGAYAASLFYAMDRFYSYATDWKKDYLDPDTYLLADRYTTANAVHQTTKLDKSEWTSYLNWLFDTEFDKIGLPRPDDVIYLEVPPALSQDLVRKRSVSDNRTMDIHEKDVGFFEKSYEAALFTAKHCGWTKIACHTEKNGTLAMRSMDEITADILSALGL